MLHLGDALDLLAAAPELPQALTLLQQLAPAVPLADGVEVDEPRLRAAAAAAPAGAHVEAVLRALAPGAPASASTPSSPARASTPPPVT